MHSVAPVKLHVTEDGQRVDPLAPESLFDETISLKKKLVAWAINQGVATVLLVMILFGIYDSTPKVIEQIQQGYTTNAQQLERVIDMNNRQLERVMNSVETDRKTLIEMLKTFREDINKNE